MKVGIVLGTRPEIIKMCPIIRYLQRQRIPFFVVHTGQHYDYEMDKIFFKDLELKDPKYTLNVGSGKHGQQTGKLLTKIEEVLIEELPDIVLVQGDTNSVMAGAIAATKLHIKVGHIEAGLRSYDWRMPEEKNRIIADHISEYLFAPTALAKRVLKKEGLPDDRIFVTGNTVVDSMLQNIKIARRKSNILKKLNLKPKKFMIMTAHREENVDNLDGLQNILRGAGNIAKHFKQPVIYPIHPRTLNRIKNFELKVPEGLTLVKPIGFLDFITLEANASLAITDSGGVQEETCTFGTPCVVIRLTSDRQEAIDVGSARLSGVDAERMLTTAKSMIGKKGGWENPYGDGRASERIIEILRTKFENETFDFRI